MFIVQIMYLDPITQIDALLEEHRVYLKKYYEQGKFVLSGPQVPRRGGVIIANVNSVMDLEGIINEDPFKREGAARYEIVEFTPTMYSPELSGLFKESL
jgi:uncharacterized protein YciI